FAKGDPYLVNPTATAFLRAGDLADRATYYRYDLAFPAADTNTPPVAGYPHTFAAPITDPNPTIKAVALAAQRQMATFFATDGQVIDPLTDITTPYGQHLFEVPIQGPLPEGLNYSGSATDGAPAQASGSLASGPIPTGAATNARNGEPPEWFLLATPVP